jgi:hypothetical protein
MAVMIGIDPHKGSHTAVAVGAAEEPLGKPVLRPSTRVRAARRRSSALTCSAPSRTA